VTAPRSVPDINDPAAVTELVDNARSLGFELVHHEGQGFRLHGNEVHFGGTMDACAAFLVGWGTLRNFLLTSLHAVSSSVPPGAPSLREITRETINQAPTRPRPHLLPGKPTIERTLTRDQRQAMVMAWAEAAFGREEATGLPQRGLRLLEEAIETFQACGGNAEIAHELVTYMFRRPQGTIGQELGGVAVSLLALAAAVGLSADEEERREIDRVLKEPVEKFTRRNADRNAAGFKITDAKSPLPRNPCCGNPGTHGEGRREYCSTCGADLGERAFP